MTNNARATPLQPPLSADPYALAARFALGLSGLVAIVTLAFAVFTHTPSMRADRTGMQSAPHDSPHSRWSPAAIEVEGDPVLFTNPFDENEVFEFPHGTSESEARAAVAEMLMERARQRYVQLDARSHKRS